MRLFVAIEIAAGPRREVARRAEAVKRRLPAARWVREEALHLSLLFLGERPAGDLPPLRAVLAEATAVQPVFSLALVGAGGFPPGRPARVVWVGAVAEPAAHLAALHAAVAAAAVAAVGHEPEARPFQPHLTLARCPRPWPRAAVDSLAAAFAGPLGDPFPVSRVVLFESRLGAGAGGGPAYRPVAEFPLAPLGEAA